MFTEDYKALLSQGLDKLGRQVKAQQQLSFPNNPFFSKEKPEVKEAGKVFQASPHIHFIP